MLKKKWQKFFISVISITFLFGLPSAFAEDKINIGSLNDMTGATSDVGKDYAVCLV